MDIQVSRSLRFIPIPGTTVESIFSVSTQTYKHLKACCHLRGHKSNVIRTLKRIICYLRSNGINSFDLSMIGTRWSSSRLIAIRNLFQLSNPACAETRMKKGSSIFSINDTPRDSSISIVRSIRRFFIVCSIRAWKEGSRVIISDIYISYASKDRYHLGISSEKQYIFIYIYIFVFIYVLLLYCGLLNKLCYSLGFTFIQNWKKQRVGEHDPPIRTRIARRSF